MKTNTQSYPVENIFEFLSKLKNVLLSTIKKHGKVTINFKDIISENIEIVKTNEENTFISPEFFIFGIGIKSSVLVFNNYFINNIPSDHVLHISLFNDLLEKHDNIVDNTDSGTIKANGTSDTNNLHQVIQDTRLKRAINNYTTRTLYNKDQVNYFYLVLKSSIDTSRSIKTTSTLIKKNDYSIMISFKKPIVIKVNLEDPSNPLLTWYINKNK